MSSNPTDEFSEPVYEQTPYGDEILPDGRIAHYFRRGADGVLRCSRCPAISGSGGYPQKQSA